VAGFVRNNEETLDTGDGMHLVAIEEEILRAREESWDFRCRIRFFGKKYQQHHNIYLAMRQYGANKQNGVEIMLSRAFSF
jgi:hypothetical protein